MIIITGMHSSGTSLTAKFLQECGVTFSREDAASNSPFYAVYEDRRFQQCTYSIIADLRPEVDYWPKFYTPRHLPMPHDLTLQRMRRLLSAQKGENWGFKDPGNSLVLGTWLQEIMRAGFQPHVVHVYRNPAEVIKSMMNWRPDFMREAIKSGGDVETWWRVYNWSVIEAYRSGYPSVPFMFVNASKLPTIDKLICEQLDLKYSPITDIMDKESLKTLKYFSSHNETDLIWNELETLSGETLHTLKASA